MRKFLLALIATLALAVAACAPGAEDQFSPLPGQTVDPFVPGEPGMTPELTPLDQPLP
jgi:hypothetical protein